jgi:hypothetical protein
VWPSAGAEHGSFELRGTREEQIVLEMDVLVEVALEEPRLS